MSSIQLLVFAVLLVVIVAGLTYLLEIRNPRRSWILIVAVLLPVAVFVALFIYQA